MLWFHSAKCVLLFHKFKFTVTVQRRFYTVLAKECQYNAVRVVDFATSKNLDFKSTMFPYYNILKYTWTCPEGKMRNQIDHVLICRRRH
jgi:hypothetical protein